MTTRSAHTGISITGLVMGILSLLLFWFPGIHLILGTLAIVFGGIATSRNQQFGIVGLVCGIASFIIGWTYVLIIMSVV
jgi:hypothetical protein